MKQPRAKRKSDVYYWLVRADTLHGDQPSVHRPYPMRVHRPEKDTSLSYAATEPALCFVAVYTVRRRRFTSVAAKAEPTNTNPPGSGVGTR